MTSIPLENIEDLFLPNEDTKDNVPHSILVIGRPGIGKTVLTKKFFVIGRKNSFRIIVTRLPSFSN